eukprot:2944887-Pyramimonas_sp.AAC.1
MTTSTTADAPGSSAGSTWRRPSWCRGILGLPTAERVLSAARRAGAEREIPRSVEWASAAGP